MSIGTEKEILHTDYSIVRLIDQSNPHFAVHVSLFDPRPDRPLKFRPVRPKLRRMEPLSRASSRTPIDRDFERPAPVRATRLTPSVTVSIGIDVRVGASAADFVEVRPAVVPPVQPNDARGGRLTPRLALVPVSPPGPRATPGFAVAMRATMGPAQVRLSNEVTHLDQVQRAVGAYLLPPGSTPDEEA